MRIAILASGRGTNARALMEAERRGKLGGAQICLLLSDNPDAPALDAAREFGKSCLAIPTGAKGARFGKDAELEYLKALSGAKADFVILAGFMKIVPDSMIRAYEGRIINLHPSLLPAYKGKDAIARAYAAGEKLCGCSVHHVTPELDGGSVIAQSKVDILPGETLAEVEGKVHAAEHALIVKVAAKFAAEFAKDTKNAV